MILEPRHVLLTCMVVVLFSGCFVDNGIGPDQGGETGSNLRPEGSPDFLILSVAGHAFSFGTPECNGVPYNCEYLWARETLSMLGNVFGAHGYEWQLWAYVDELESHYDDLDGDGLLGPEDEMLANGFLFLLSHIDWLIENWIADFDNPTRIVVIAHSHGGVWAHSALMLRPELPVDVLIDLDTNSLCWETDVSCAFNGDSWQAAIDNHVSEWAPDWSFDVGDASQSWSIPGLSTLQDIEDVVPDSVGVNLEVQTDDWPALDAEANHRLDGSQLDISTELFYESHSDVTQPNSQAMRWVVERVDAVYDWP